MDDDHDTEPGTPSPVEADEAREDLPTHVSGIDGLDLDLECSERGMARNPRAEAGSHPTLEARVAWTERSLCDVEFVPKKRRRRR